MSGQRIFGDLEERALDRRDRSKTWAILAHLALMALWIADYLTRSEVRSDASLVVLAISTACFAGAYVTVDWQTAPWWLKPVPFISYTTLIALAVLWADSDQSRGSSSALVLCLSLGLIGIGFFFGRGFPLIVGALVGSAFLWLDYENLLATESEAIWMGVPAAALLGELSVTSRSIAADNRLEVARRLNQTLTDFRRPRKISDAATGIAKATERLFEANYVTVVLRSPDGELVSSHAGKATGKAAKEPDEETASLVVKAIGGQEPRIVDYNGAPLLICPIPSAESPAGAVVAHPFPNVDLEFLTLTAKLFSHQIGMSIQHLYEYDALEKAARTDELTGIGNRKHANELVSSLRAGDALILLDLDGFKAVNDEFGHPAGDQVLLDLSDHLKSCLRDSDTSARLGGDEFLVVAKRAFADPQAVARRILTGWDVPGRSTTLSAGVALHEENTEPEQTYKRADKALYEAKEAGKNQSKLWQNSPEDED